MRHIVHGKMHIFLCLILIFLSFGYMTAPINAESSIGFSDTKGHWAESSINRWAELGIIKGADGKFRPNDNVTRAELAVILNRLLMYPDQAENPFNDFDEKAWYYQDVLNLAKHGMLHVIGDRFNGNEFLKRQEAVYMIGNAFGVGGISNYRINNNNPNVYKDWDQADNWADPVIQNMFRLGYLKGNPGGNFNPQNLITRAEITSILGNMVDVIIDIPGTYTGYTNREDTKILVRSKDVIIDDCRYIHVFVAPSVKDGYVTLGENADCRQAFIVGESSDILSGKRASTHFTYLAPLNPIRDERFKGKGTETEPYQVSNMEQLRYIDDFTDLPAFPTTYFILTDDIKLEGEWTPLCQGTASNGSFVGYFDGNGHTISNIQINGTRSGGLFYSISGEVKNLNLEGAHITQTSNSAHCPRAGLLATSNKGRIENCTAKVNINVKGQYGVSVGGLVASSYGGIMENCSVTGTLVTDCYNSIRYDVFVGGLCGYVDSSTKITNCKSSVNIKSTVDGAMLALINVGGLVGTGGTIENSSASGDVELIFINTHKKEVNPSAGGLVGSLSQGVISNCYATGNVKVEGEGYYNFAGGLVGIAGNLNDGRHVRIQKSYSTGNVNCSGASMQNNSGGVVGQIELGDVSECWSKGNVSASGNPEYFNAVGGFVGSCYEGGNISDSYTVSSVSVSGNIFSAGAFAGRLAGSIETSYAAGDEVPDSFIGSARGNPVLVNCGDFFKKSKFYPAFYTGSGSASGVVGVTAEELTKESTYTSRNWDFVNIWTFVDGGNYKLPVLRNVHINVQK